LTDEQLNVLYSDVVAYLKMWDRAVENSRSQGLILEADLDDQRAHGRTIAADLWPA
jgi:hypothetical protein